MVRARGGCERRQMRRRRAGRWRARCHGTRGRGMAALLGEEVRLYVATLADGVVDVVGGTGDLIARWELGGDDDVRRATLAEALLRDATGHAPKPATVAAFRTEVLD